MHINTAFGMSKERPLFSAFFFIFRCFVMECTSTPTRTTSRQSTSESQPDDVLSQQSEETPPPCWLLCWYLLSWSFAIITYVTEGFAIVWVAINYSNFELYPNLVLTLLCYFIASVVNGSISLFWYYDLDRVSIKQLEASGPFPGVYKRKCSFAAIATHCLLLGEVYR